MIKNPDAVNLGKRRFASMTAAEQREAQSKAAVARWAGTTPAQRRAHSLLMAAARKKKSAARK